jgi:predicted Rossmann fold nucleotide-binding protein DprA/Smf involved in DNA uptake
MLKKIISGGQTGVDRAALDAAIRMGISHGGWIPKGRLTEDGPLSEIYHLVEMETDSYPERTEKNVVISDGTLIISRGPLSGGTDYTRKMVLKHGKQMLHIDPALHSNLLDAASLVSSWIEMQKIEILNVAGPRASKDPDIYGQALGILTHIK